MSLPKSVYKKLPKRLPKSLGFSRYALDFDGVEDHIPNPVANPAGPNTISLWFRTTSSVPARQTFSWLWGNGAIIQIDSGELYYYDGSYHRISGTNPDDTKWHHLVRTDDRSNYKFYMDGELVETSSGVATLQTGAKK